MPYIKPERRKLFDTQINAINDTIKKNDATEGDLNYILSRIIGSVFLNEPRYHTICRISGVFDNVSREFYRRIAIAYEDRAIEENGDVPEYSWIEKEILNDD